MQHSGLEELLARGRPSLLEVPGVAAAGWTSAQLYRGATDRDRHSAQNKLTAFLKALLDRVRAFKEAALFAQPPPASEVRPSTPFIPAESLYASHPC